MLKPKSAPPSPTLSAPSSERRIYLTLLSRFAPRVYRWTQKGSMAALVDRFKTDEASTYHALRHHVRISHDGLLRRITARHGFVKLKRIDARTLKSWHREWSNNGEKIAIGHAFMGQLRTLFSFGTTLHEDPECVRLSQIMSKMRFPMVKPRTQRLTPEQANAIRLAAHNKGWHSIALAQALQFECFLRQKDVIGERVPESEPGPGIMLANGDKWMRGLVWEEIDDNLILRHLTSKKQKEVEFDLHDAPMVLEELALLGDRPQSGIIIRAEFNGEPYKTGEYRRKWRIVANLAGIPKEVRSQDTRSGAITEASEAGADLEHIKHAAAHSNIAQTQQYSRAPREKTRRVQKQRIAHRTRVQSHTTATNTAAPERKIG